MSRYVKSNYRKRNNCVKEVVNNIITKDKYNINIVESGNNSFPFYKSDEDMYWRYELANAIFNMEYDDIVVSFTDTSTESPMYCVKNNTIIKIYEDEYFYSRRYINPDIYTSSADAGDQLWENSKPGFKNKLSILNTIFNLVFGNDFLNHFDLPKSTSKKRKHFIDVWDQRSYDIKLPWDTPRRNQLVEVYPNKLQQLFLKNGRYRNTTKKNMPDHIRVYHLSSREYDFYNGLNNTNIDTAKETKAVLDIANRVMDARQRTASGPAISYFKFVLIIYGRIIAQDLTLSQIEHYYEDPRNHNYYDEIINTDPISHPKNISEWYNDGGMKMVNNHERHMDGIYDFLRHHLHNRYINNSDDKANHTLNMAKALNNV